LLDYHPAHWKEAQRAHVFTELSTLFKSKPQSFLIELLSVVMCPVILFFYLPENVDSVVERVTSCLVAHPVEGMAHVVSLPHHRSSEKSERENIGSHVSQYVSYDADERSLIAAKDDSSSEDDQYSLSTERKQVSSCHNTSSRVLMPSIDSLVVAANGDQSQVIVFFRRNSRW
jgi:hypothetical protein